MFYENRPVNRYNKRRKNKIGGASFWKDVSSVATASLLLHGFIFLLISLVPPERPKSEKKSVTLITDFEEVEIEDLLPELEIEIPEMDELMDIDLADIEVSENSEEVPLEELVDIEEEAFDDISDDAFEGLDMLEDFEGETGDGYDSLAVLGEDFSKSLGDGLPATYSGRSGEQKTKKTKQYGGREEVLDAVDLALEWLAAHQLPDGNWPFIPGLQQEVVKNKGKASSKKSSKKSSKEIVVNKIVNGEEKNKEKANNHGIKDPRASITACALLAFLGAGHNENSGPYKQVVRKGIRYLNAVVSKQLASKKHKSIDRNYGSAIILMALSESSIFGSSPVTKRNANKIAEHFLKTYKGQGWGYNGGGDDFSVSGWVALGLKSARQAEVEALTDEKIKPLFKSYGKWVNEMTDPLTGQGNYRPKKVGSVAMSWVGMFQKHFLGFPLNDPFLVKATEFGLTKMGSVFDVKKKSWRNEYAVYYGTLAAFQQQGNFWKKWNLAMQATLLPTQREGDPKDLGGSWDPTKSSIGDTGGRVMTTALMTLCLEVYYRYAMMN
jgi:hypothetical protein